MNKLRRIRMALSGDSRQFPLRVRIGASQTRGARGATLEEATKTLEELDEALSGVDALIGALTLARREVADAASPIRDLVGAEVRAAKTEGRKSRPVRRGKARG